MNWPKFPNPRLWTHVELISIDAINLVLVLITIEWCYYTYWWMKLYWLRVILMMMAFEGELVRLCDLEPLLQLLWLLLGYEVQLKHVFWLNKVGVGMIMKLKCLDYVILRLCLKCNNIRVVMNFLCALLWHDDDNVLLSEMKGCHEWTISWIF